MTMESTIVSLLPAATEIVCALGLRSRLVGRSHACDHPADVATLPALTAPHLDPSRPAAEIDAQVRRLAEAHEALYRLDETRLEALAPGVIVTQAACAVCALSEEEVAAFAGRALPGTTIVSLSPRRLDDVLADVEAVARACGAEAAGHRLRARLEDRLGALSPPPRVRPRVAVLEWLDPPMLAGHWVPEAVELAGGAPLGPGAGERARTVSWREVEALGADALVVVPCGFDLERTRRESRPLRAQLAGTAPAVLLLDGNATFSRPGPRVVDGVEALSAFLHGARLPGVLAERLS